MRFAIGGNTAREHSDMAILGTFTVDNPPTCTSPNRYARPTVMPSVDGKEIGQHTPGGPVTVHQMDRSELFCFESRV